MAGTGFAHAARKTLDDWKAARRRVLRSGATRNAVHEWRICTRRLLALEALLSPRAVPARGGPLGAMLHDAFHASGRLRDAQLIRRSMSALADAFPAAARLARHEKRRIPRLERHLLRELRRLSGADLGRIIEGWQPRDDGDPRQVHAIRAGRRLLAEHRRLARPPAGHIAPHALHRHRIGLKRVRYMAELCRAAGCRLPGGLDAARLAALQRGLGRLTDLDMELRALSGFIEDHPKWRRPASGLRRELRRLRRQELDALLRGPSPATGRARAASL